VSSSLHKNLRTEILQQNHQSILLPFILCVFGTILFYVMSPYIVPRQFFLHIPTLFFLWITLKRSSLFSMFIAIALGVTTEVLLSLTIGSGVFTYMVSFGAIKILEPLWDLHYKTHKLGYGITFLCIWHSVFWFMH